MPTSFKSNTNINIDGKEYTSLDQVPEEFRKFINDEDADGMPDFVEDILAHTNADKDSIEINGIQYDSWDEVPAEHQSLRPAASQPPIPPSANQSSTPSTPPKSHHTQPSKYTPAPSQTAGLNQTYLIIGLIVAVMVLIAYIFIN